jgi:hypothetical protein
VDRRCPGQKIEHVGVRPDQNAAAAGRHAAVDDLGGALGRGEGDRVELLDRLLAGQPTAERIAVEAGVASDVGLRARSGWCSTTPALPVRGICASW